MNEEIKDLPEVRQVPRKVKALIPAAAIAALFLLGIALFFIIRNLPARGYKNYTVQMQQYYVEYSDEYEYSDVLTVEYPCLEGIDETVQEQLNNQLYEAAMDRANYWHFHPDEEVSSFQEENFTIFCSDVSCDITFHSQYLLSADFQEIYAPGNPVWFVNFAKRGITVDLLTGETYELADIVKIDSDFIRLWCESLEPSWSNSSDFEEQVQMLNNWFLKEDPDLNGFYQLQPFFYITEDKNFVIGLSIDPMPSIIYTSTPQDNTYCTPIEAEALIPYRTDSDFWDKFDQSENAGTVLPCTDLQDNLWLGEDASAWTYWDSKGFSGTEWRQAHGHHE